MEYGSIVTLLPHESPTCPGCQIPTRVVADMREGDIICSECGLVFKSEKVQIVSFCDTERTSSQGMSAPKNFRYAHTHSTEKSRWKSRMSNITSNSEVWYPLNAAMRACDYVDWVLDVHTFANRDQSVVMAAAMHQVSGEGARFQKSNVNF
jgi:hypothetical protein